ncbi:hypothetical protein Lfu02_59050 [Longispora fulva]|uniref:Uncharacterized protein n=1 Tax=Longispora fulva TaxID=619741 RepID=A0A8J7GRY6_9ACTN|nr:hypothetical protein [Longispora fulva]MBG6137113.1 hypothetical protein [Longispora fulva]GIG61533.1 hypothetical protein Lfu02_59050 [Longispora fulva]
MTMPGRSEVLALLRQFDDPDLLEHPAGFDYRAEQDRFRALASSLGRRLDCVCDVDAGMNVQDASYLGQLVVPAAATVGGTAIFVRVSNFGGLALFGAERPGIYDDEETLILIGERDLRAVLEALAEFGYVPLLEDVLAREYDGTSDALREAYTRYPASWFIRYFDYL